MIESKIPGLEFRENKIVGDPRGVLAELLPDGTGHPLAPRIGNVYAAIATGQYVPRAAHYHKKKIENAFTLSGTCLWVFKDMREGSSGAMQAVIAGATAPADSHDIPVYTFDRGLMLHIHIEPWIYHILYPLSADPVTVVIAASEPFDITDDYRFPDLEVPGIREYIERFV
ncbi:MAG: hypothetical protein Q7S89_02560 [bacterium]|nr:hypothetical protein [bacterium]